MTKTEYINSIKAHLRRLPKQDLDQALEYFNEYFEEAGPDQEAKAMEDLGDPKIVAAELLRNMAISNAEEPKEKSIKRNLDSVWIGILAVCAAPIGIPVIFALVVVIFALLISLIAVIGSFLFSGVVAAASSVIPFVAGFFLFGSYPASGIMTLGISFMMAGIGILITVGGAVLGRLCLQGITRLIGHGVKGGKRHDKN